MKFYNIKLDLLRRYKYFYIIIQLDIIGLNKKTYQIVRQEFQLNIVKKSGKHTKIVLFYNLIIIRINCYIINY